MRTETPFEYAPLLVTKYQEAGRALGEANTAVDHAEQALRAAQAVRETLFGQYRQAEDDLQQAMREHEESGGRG